MFLIDTRIFEEQYQDYLQYNCIYTSYSLGLHTAPTPLKIALPMFQYMTAIVLTISEKSIVLSLILTSQEFTTKTFIARGHNKTRPTEVGNDGKA